MSLFCKRGAAVKNRSIELKSYAKINLSLHVTGKRDDGYHDIYSVMQGVNIYDEIKLEFLDKIDKKKTFNHCFINGIDIEFSIRRSNLSTGPDNLALRGAKAILEKAPQERDFPVGIKIELTKNLPVAAGLAGGSGNAAVTMLALNELLDDPFSLDELMELGAGVGADVPFSIMMNAAANADRLNGLRGLEKASVTALVRGIGDIVEAMDPIERYVILINPGAGVSTAEAYGAIDSLRGEQLNGEEEDFPLWVNDFERYTYSTCEAARELKAAMDEQLSADCVLMSGSGSTIIAYYIDGERARDDFDRINKDGLLRPNWRAWYAESGGSII